MKTDATRQSRRDLDAVLGVLFDLGLRCGLDQQDIQKLCNDKLAELKDRKPSLQSDLDLSVQVRDFLSTMNGAWHKLNSFTDDLGNPVPLPSSGHKLSLEALYAASGAITGNAPVTFEKAFELLQGHDAIVEAGKELWLPKDEVLYVNRSSSVAVHPQLAYIREFVSTVGVNINLPGRKGLFCMFSRVSGVPEVNFKELNAICSDSGLSFLRQVDGVLEQRRDEAFTSHEPKITAGVGLYVFRT